MSARVHFVMPEELVERIDSAAGLLGISRGEFVRRAVGAELEIDYRTPGAIHEYTQGERQEIASAVVHPATRAPDAPMCRVCVKNGPPRTRPCAKCGHQK